MKAELIQEMQLLQNSMANKYADDLNESLKNTVDYVTKKVSSSIAKRGKMLMMLDKRLNFSSLRRFKSKFFKF